MNTRPLTAGEIALAPLALIYLLLAKVLATGVTIGMGMPVGLIGPNMLIGACMGALLGSLGMAWIPGFQGDSTLYVVIAMAAAEGLAIETVQPQRVEEVLGVNDRVQLAALERCWQRRECDWGVCSSPPAEHQYARLQ